MKNTINYYWHQSEEKSSMLTQYAEGGGGGMNFHLMVHNSVNVWDGTEVMVIVIIKYFMFMSNQMHEFWVYVRILSEILRSLASICHYQLVTGVSKTMVI